MSEASWQETHRALRLTRFALRTEQRDNGHGRDRTGFTGTATLRVARDAPAGAKPVLGALARVAEFCGTGAQTTHGFGATVITPDNRGRDG